MSYFALMNCYIELLNYQEADTQSEQSLFVCVFVEKWRY